jgi:molybdopterin-guanine dinucleotide biosynthesis protein A
MGRDKRVIEIDGKPLWLRQLELLQSLYPPEVLISGPLNGPWMGNDYCVIPDEEIGNGPLAGITAALKSIRSPLALMLAVDMPNMSLTYLKSLLIGCTTTCGIVPVRNDSLEPLAAIYPKACSRIASECILENNFRLQPFVQKCIEAGLVKTRKVKAGEEVFFANLNSPADVESLK